MFINCENEFGLHVIWVNVSQINYIEESRYGDGSLASYTIHCIDNTLYYSQDFERIQKILGVKE